MLERTLLTSEQKVKFKLSPGTAFIKKIRLKDKYKNAIPVNNLYFRAQLIKNFTDEDIVATLTLDNGAITTNTNRNEVTFIVAKEFTVGLLESDSGRWTIEYSEDNVNWQVLLNGFWCVDVDIFNEAYLEVDSEDLPEVLPEA